MRNLSKDHIHAHPYVSSANFSSNCRLLSEDGEMKIYGQTQLIQLIAEAMPYIVFDQLRNILNITS